MIPLDSAAPFTKLTGHQFPISKLQVFGAPAFVHTEKGAQRRKLDPRARRGIYVGFSEGAKICPFNVAAHMLWRQDLAVKLISFSMWDSLLSAAEVAPLIFISGWGFVTVRRVDGQPRSSTGANTLD